ncbi:MAG: glycine zipper 2TM domain-containing protein [Deltaproteobacteria bacterium]|nr:glycine zipper 2TM domain-containing protein [Deltaproteobacteria bacterium]
MTRKGVLKAFAALLALSLAACAGGPKEQVGTVLGGVAGGVAGAQIGGGSGRIVGAAVGTLLGAVVGQEIGRSLDKADELKAAHALEKNKTGEASTWVNPDKGSQVTVVPTRTYQQAGGEYCREYQTEVVVGGKTEKAYGRACRQPDGQWKMTH